MDLVTVLFELRIARAHLLDHDVGEPREIRRLEAHAPCLLDGAPHDPAHHVAAALVRGRHAVRGEEGHAAAVVGQDAMRLGRLGRVAVRDTRLRGDPLHDQLVAVGVVDGRNLLDDARGALETHPGIDVLLR